MCIRSHGCRAPKHCVSSCGPARGVDLVRTRRISTPDRLGHPAAGRAVGPGRATLVPVDDIVRWMGIFGAAGGEDGSHLQGEISGFVNGPQKHQLFLLKTRVCVVLEFNLR